MLISFDVRNFRSIRADAHLSMLAEKGDKAGAVSLIQRKISSKEIQLSLVPSVAIYGPNGSGKSNILQAMDYMDTAVIRSHAFWKPNSGTHLSQFAFGDESDDLSVFNIDFVVDSVRFNYGFSATKKVFREEWLYFYPNNREKLIFSRITEEAGEGKYKSFINTGTKVKEARNLKDCEKRVRENSLVVSAAAQDGQEAALIVTEWFRERFALIDARASYEDMDVSFTSSLIANANFSNEALRYIQVADPRVLRIKVEERKKPEFLEKLEQAIGSIPEFIKEMGKYEVTFVYEKEDGSETELSLESQSRGTTRLYGMCGWIAAALVNGNVLAIDEIESSLHPHLSQFIIDLFQNPETNPNGAQLIFTTHDTNILDADILRRDQIWFVEKGKIGDTHLYPLTDYSPRKDENLQRGYLRGRYGAIPALGLSETWIKTQN